MFTKLCSKNNDNNKKNLKQKEEEESFALIAYIWDGAQFVESQPMGRTKSEFYGSAMGARYQVTSIINQI